MKKFKRSKEEYLFIRQEMLQYLNNYQSVRNMMYVSTLACLGLGIFSNNPIDQSATGEHFLFLLALAVIMPSFLVAANFWKCVAVDSCYLRVFYEEDILWVDTQMEDINDPEGAALNFRWETRHKRLFEKHPKIDDKVNIQHIPYVVCAFCCIVLYWVKLVFSEMMVIDINSFGVTVTIDFSIDNIVSVVIGLVVTFACLIIFIKNWSLKTDEIMKAWRQVREEEVR